MKKKDIIIGETYIVKVSGKLAHVYITNESPYGGWDGLNITTKRAVRIKSAARLRRRADPLPDEKKHTNHPHRFGPGRTSKPKGG